MIVMKLARTVEFDLLHPKDLFVNYIGNYNGLSMGLAGQGSAKTTESHIHIRFPMTCGVMFCASSMQGG